MLQADEIATSGYARLAMTLGALRMTSDEIAFPQTAAGSSTSGYARLAMTLASLGSAEAIALGLYTLQRDCRAASGGSQ